MPTNHLQSPLILLTLLYTTTIIHSACVIPSYSQCFEIEDTLCSRFSATILNGTCTESGYPIGSCCVGECFLSTYSFCSTLLGGTWNQNGECPCEVEVGACCLNGVCSEKYDEDSCVSNGGVYAGDKQCSSGFCHAEYGACCKGDVCYDGVPGGYCDGAFFGGKVCEETCIDNPTSIDTTIYTPGANGRCCTSDLCTEVASVSDCSGVYTEGIGCSASLPCNRWGACLRNGFCLNPVVEGLCSTYGGSFFEGATCPDQEQGICIYRDDKYCTQFSQLECVVLSGHWSNQTQCPDGFPPLGSCCISGACIYTNEKLCSLQSITWTEGEPCPEDDIPCTDTEQTGTCCISGLCIGATSRYRECLYLASINKEVLGESDMVVFTEGVGCPLSGICDESAFSLYLDLSDSKNVTIPKTNSLNWLGISVSLVGESHSFEAGEISILEGSTFNVTQITVSLDKLSAESKSSTTLTKTTGIIDTISISGSSNTTIKSSSIQVGSIDLELGSVLSLSSDNEITVLSCADLNGKLELSVSSSQNTQLESEGSLDIVFLSSACLNFEGEYAVDADLNECTSHSLITTGKSLILSMTFQTECTAATSISSLIIGPSLLLLTLYFL